MDKIIWKSMVAPNFKAEEPVNDGTVAPDAEDLPITESDVENEIAGILDGTETAEAPNPFGLTIDKPTPAGVSFDPATGEQIADPKASLYYVPSMDVAITKAKEQKIVLNSSAFDGFEKIYKEKLKSYQGERQNILQKLASGGISFNEADYYKQLLLSLEDSIKVIEDSLAMIPIMRAEDKEVKKEEYAKFMELAAPYAEEFNAGTNEQRSGIVQKLLAADINGDLMIGDSISIVLDTDQGAVLQDVETLKIIRRILPDGTPMTSKWFTNKTWEAFKAGVALSNLKIAGEDAVFEITNSSATAEDDNTLSAKIDMAVPDFVTIMAKDGEAVTEVRSDAELHYVAVDLQTEGGKVVQIPQDDPEHYMQVRVAKVEVFSYEQSEEKTGYDQGIRLLTADGIIAAEYRFTGKNGIKPASDYAIALNGSQRFEAISVDASQAIFTGTTAINNKTLKETYEKYGVKVPTSKNKGEENFEENMSVFQGYSGQADENSIYTGAFMVEGLSGYFQGAVKGNNLFFLKDPTTTDTAKEAIKNSGTKDDKIDIDALSANVVIGNGNYNVAFSKGGGDFYAWDMTLVQRDATKIGAISAVKAKDFVTKNGSVVNAHNYISLEGYGDKFIDNPSDTEDTDANGPKTKAGDDYFFSNGTASYSTPRDSVNENLGDPDADNDEGGEESLKGVFDQSIMTQEGGAIEEAIAALGEEEDDPYVALETQNFGGDFFNAMNKTQESFLTDLSNIFGFKNEAMDKWAEENPIEKDPLAVKEKEGLE